MSGYVIRAIRNESTGQSLDGQYLQHYDPDAYQGGGWAEWTTEPSLAIRFRTRTEAFTYWRQTSTIRPRRDDGKDNRPLTAFTISIEQLDD